MAQGANGELEQTQAFQAWGAGYGVVQHNETTQARIRALAQRLETHGGPGLTEVCRVLAAADRLASAAMWLVVHMTYARRVDMSGKALAATDFKPTPEGHTGGSLNMVPAYVGYLAANLLSGTTRSWIMGQGHCVAAIEAVNVLVGNLSAEQSQRYAPTDAGLTQLVQDFYSYAVTPQGRPAVPLGSHVNVHTAGGISEGGYLGFAEVQYVHMPLPGESLVAFLSDGAFEEQRGSDWSPRWWRAEDSGAVMPIMVLNGRRIEQRTGIVQEGGAGWLTQHLLLNGFDPVEIDGHDPAAYAWAVLEMEHRLLQTGERVRQGLEHYPIRLPYAMATCVKGYGFPGAGTNHAHNLPLEGNPHHDVQARADFNAGARGLHVTPTELAEVRTAFSRHATQGRAREAEHPLARRCVATPIMPPVNWTPAGAPVTSPMQAIDAWFVALVGANPDLRVRLGNPDELRSNQMGNTLELLKHRADDPEPGMPEAVDGAVITVLNEEAVIGAVLGNKAGLNLAVSYEAFAVKMLGALRQEILFARHQREVGRPPGWLGMPLLLTSHTWENGKNEQSHQDPTLAEALLGEMSDTARVMFPVDANSAVAALGETYRAHGVIGVLVVPKRPVACLLDPAQAEYASRRGALALLAATAQTAVQLVAVGAYQLGQALQAQERLAERGVAAAVACVIEPGRLRLPRDEIEARVVWTDAEINAMFPAELPRVIISHTRPEPMLGVLRRLDGGRAYTRALGYINHGGTLDTPGMLFANRCSWAHIVDAAAGVLDLAADGLLEADELAAVKSVGDAAVLWSDVRA